MRYTNSCGKNPEEHLGTSAVYLEPLKQSQANVIIKQECKDIPKTGNNDLQNEIKFKKQKLSMHKKLRVHQANYAKAQKISNYLKQC